VFAPYPAKDTTDASRKHGNKSSNGFLTAEKANKYIDLYRKKNIGE